MGYRDIFVLDDILDSFRRMWIFACLLNILCVLYSVYKYRYGIEYYRLLFIDLLGTLVVELK